MIQNCEERLIPQAHIAIQRPQQVGEMDQQEPHEVQQWQMQSPAAEERQPHAPEYAGYPTGKHLVRKGSGGPAEHQVEHEPGACLCDKGKWYQGLH